MVEAVNEAMTVYDTSGNVLVGPISLANLFQDPNASGDVSCNYDPATHSFFFTEIGGVDDAFLGTGLVVMNSNGYAAYGIDTAEGGNCLPDFPQQGFNDNAFYITVREFCGANRRFRRRECVRAFEVAARQLRADGERGLFLAAGRPGGHPS